MYHLTAAAAAYTITRVSEHNIRKPKHTSSYIHSFVSYKDLKHSSKKKLNTQISLNAESSNQMLTCSGKHSPSSTAIFCGQIWNLMIQLVNILDTAQLLKIAASGSVFLSVSLSLFFFFFFLRTKHSNLLVFPWLFKWQRTSDCKTIKLVTERVPGFLAHLPYLQPPIIPRACNHDLWNTQNSCNISWSENHCCLESLMKRAFVILLISSF